MEKDSDAKNQLSRLQVMNTSFIHLLNLSFLLLNILSAKIKASALPTSIKVTNYHQLYFDTKILQIYKYKD